MTRSTLIDGQMAGVSGDMFLGAMIDAGAEVKMIQQVLNLIPKHFPKCKSIKLSPSETKKHGFRSCRAELMIDEDADETRAQTLIDATAAIARAAHLSKEAESFAGNAVRLLTDAESKLHGVDLSSTHLHEAGATDTLADILGTAAGCDSLQLFDGEVHSYPIAVGGGTVAFSHGTISVPAPAVLEIARSHGIPITGGPVASELTTPTGVSILASLVDDYVETPPPLIPEKVGYGAGKMELANSPNVLRIIIGQTTDQPFDRDAVEIVEANLDDVSGEVIGSSIQFILDAGAKDAWITTAQFKKSRPGFTLHALCAPHDLERVAGAMMASTGTIGVRYHRWDRFILPREIISIKLTLDGMVHEARVKVARDRTGKIARIKPESDDVESIARKTSRAPNDVAALVVEEARKTSVRHEPVNASS